MATASALDLSVESAVLLNDSNRIAVRLLPCNVLARVAAGEHRRATTFEVEVAQWLAETDSPIAPLEPRVEPRAYMRDEFVVTFWTFYELASSEDIAPLEYAQALRRMHAGMQTVDPPTPHFTDRVAEAQRLLDSSEQTPDLRRGDRELLSATLTGMKQAIERRGHAEQVLHGEPHPGNVLSTRQGVLFTDLETCCRGPVEFDIAHAPEEISDHYPGIDQDLLRECRILMLAMVTTWRWDRNDDLPDGRRWASRWISELRFELNRYRSDTSA